MMEGLCTFAELVQYGLALRLQSAQLQSSITVKYQQLQSALLAPGRVQCGLAPRLAPIAVDGLNRMRRVRA